jgi:hypothetical protein
MTLNSEGQPLLQFALWACFFLCAAGLFTAIYASILAISRTGALINRVEDRSFRWGERAGRKSSRMNRFLVANEFRSLRKLYFGAWTVTILSFGLLFFLVAFFGERKPL